MDGYGKNDKRGNRMSKYYKAEDVIRAIAENLAWNDNRKNKGKNDCIDNWEEWIEDAEDVVYNLPTIEVSDKADRPFEYFEGYEDGKKSVEISEDCISREQLKSLSYINKGNFNSVEGIRDWIDAAPSVIPKPKGGEWIKDNLGTVICSECKRPRRDSRINHTKFCNSCGSKMKGADDE